jgi:hypothetical protein
MQGGESFGLHYEAVLVLRNVCPTRFKLNNPQAIGRCLLVRWSGSGSSALLHSTEQTSPAASDIHPGGRVIRLPESRSRGELLKIAIQWT